MNPTDPNQGGQPPVIDPNAGQPVPETPAPEAPVEIPQQPVSEPGTPPTGEDQGGQNPTSGAPVV